MRKSTSEEEIQKKFQEFLAKQDLNQTKETIIVLDGGKGKLVKKKAKDAKYTVLFQNDLFLQAKAIAWHERKLSFNQIVNKGLEMWVREYIKINGSRPIEEMLESSDKMNKEYFLTQRQNMVRTKGKRNK